MSATDLECHDDNDDDDDDYKKTFFEGQESEYTKLSVIIIKNKVLRNCSKASPDSLV